MKGHTPTPDELAESMVRQLFDRSPPASGDSILYPGCGTAPFPAAVERVCDAQGWDYPRGLGIELNPEHLDTAQGRDLSHVDFEQADFLDPTGVAHKEFEYIIGNPPYVPIEQLDDDEKRRYRGVFDTAVGRFDLYLLFFERALSLLAVDGWLQFITPEKYEYVDTASPLRKLLTSETYAVEQIAHIDENAFTGLVTFPCVTTVTRGPYNQTSINNRDGSTHTTRLPTDGSSWASAIRDVDVGSMQTGSTLKDVTERISPGMATGADALFVTTRDDVPPQLDPEWIRPTVSGKQLSTTDGPYTDSVFICPYQDDGTLPSASELEAFGDWASIHRERLEDRSCVQKEGKEWYAWHETPPMKDLLQPKIVFRDIAQEPQFWAEPEGTVVPRHTVYYLIPKPGVPIAELLEYLNGPKARRWMEAKCQKAANGYLRLQSRVLRDLPVPAEWTNTVQASL